MSVARRRLPLPESRGGRIALALVGAVVAVNVVAAGLDAIVPSPSGPTSSSFATKPQGLAGWAELARRSGREVRALRRAPSDTTLPRSGTVVLLDPGTVPASEVRALRRFAQRGGRVVAGGRFPGDWVATLLGAGEPPEWDGEGPRGARPLVPAPEVAGVAAVRSAGEGRWTSAGPTLPALGDGEDATVLLARAGRGRVVLVADASPLQNRLLDRDDNAALALALAGRGPLTFVETVHGYGPGGGLAALPGRFQWGLGLLLLAALTFLAARGRRLGPPEAERRALPPSRRAYVDALATTLARGKRREEASAPVCAAARVRLARLGRLPEDASDELVLAAARAAGLDDMAAAALIRPARADADVLATGRALAALARREGKA